VSQVTAKGNKVNFYEDWGEIVHIKTGRKTRFERKNGVYVLRVWVKEQGYTNTMDETPAEMPQTGFQRRG